MSHEQCFNKRWLAEALNLCPESYRREARDYLQPLLKRCHSKSRGRFWQWLRINLARTEETAILLQWMQESRLSPEVIVPHQKDGFKYTVNGDVALIEIADRDDTAIWKVPVDKLNWALAQYPVFLRRLPDLESQEAAACRRLETQLRRKGLASEKRKELEDEVTRLRAAEQKTFAPLSRFQLVKYIKGERFELHRLYLDADRGDIVETIDGDYTNFANVTLRLTSTVVAENGVGVRKGDRPLIEVEEITLPNLYIIHSNQSQRNFETGMFRIRETTQGDIDRPLPCGDAGDADFAIAGLAEDKD